MRTAVGNGQSGEAADATEQDTFCEYLANDVVAGGAECHAHGDFGSPRGGARQHQIGDVCARDE